MNRQTLFSFFSPAYYWPTVEAHNHNSRHSHHSHHSKHRNYGTITETSTNTVTVTTTSSTCEATPTNNLSCPSIAKKRDYHHRDHHRTHSYNRYKKTDTCIPTTTLCVTPTSQCLPNGAPIRKCPDDRLLCCSGGCSTADNVCDD